MKKAVGALTIIGLLSISLPALAEHDNLAVVCLLKSDLLREADSYAEGMINIYEKYRGKFTSGVEREQLREEWEKMFFDLLSHYYFVVDKPKECPSSQSDIR